MLPGGPLVLYSAEQGIVLGPSSNFKDVPAPVDNFEAVWDSSREVFGIISVGCQSELHG